ncbi:MAG: hypothetical protein MUP68_17320 [Deltaproteobacteria bacterium]|nr:hypothetical protein [Deltaproteobacteria bacterium]
MTGLFKYKVLNFFLFAVVLSTAFMNYETWSQSNESANAVAGKPETRSESAFKTEALAVKEKPESVQSFRIIAEKNIFSPERKDFPSPALTPAERPQPIVRPQVILSGVVIFGDYQAASVSIPGRPPGKGERDAMTLKVGDKIAEYKLAKISADRITLEAGGDSFEVLLYDPKKPKARIEVSTAEVKAPEINNTQPAPAFLPSVEAATAESLQNPVATAQQRVIVQASPYPSRETLISRSMRSEAIRRALMGSKQRDEGVVDSTEANKGKS